MPEIDRRSLVMGSAAIATAVAASTGLGTTEEAIGAPNDISSGDTTKKNAPNPGGATSSEKFPNLFSPIQIGGVRLKNRIVHACMSTHFVPGTEQYLDYNANRARGGAAMIVMDAAPPGAGMPGGGNGDGRRRFVDSIERHDCRLVVQLSKGGRMRFDPGRNLTAVGVSALPDDISWTVPHVLTAAELKQIIDEFAETSNQLKRTGFSGVEISASHGHLIHQILSAEANHRTDEYGGDLKGRTRFLTEMISAIRSSCGRPFIIGVKLVGEDGVPGGVDLAQSKAITQLIYATGELDYLTYGWGASADTLYWHAPMLADFPRMAFLQKIRDLAKAAPGVPLGAIGLITDPSEGEYIIRNKQADLVMLSRPLVTDAAWALKASEGRQGQIRKCVSCDTCWEVTTLLRSTIRCDNNPIVGAPDEADWQPVKAPKSKRVVIIGGGIAGMEAAWISAARGHQVTVFSASAETGGKTRLQAALPGGGGLPHVFNFQRRSADRFGVQLKLNERATLDTVLALHPEVVVLASGSTMTRPDFLPTEQGENEKFHDLRTTVAMMLVQPAVRRRGTAVIYDHDHTAMTYTAAEYLYDIFDRVVLVTPRGGVAKDESVISRQSIYHRLSSRKIEIVIFSTPSESSHFSEGKIICTSSYDGSQKIIDDVALFTYSTSRTPNDELANPLRAQGIEPYIIGDCWAPRLLLTATSDGHKIGTTI